jgi:hypothetical protein
MIVILATALKPSAGGEAKPQASIEG